MKLYYCELSWWNEYNDEENKETMFVFGETIVEASKAIHEAFEDIINFSLSEINSDCSHNILYLPDDCPCIEKIKDVNNY